MIFETKRLLLRAMKEEDFETLHKEIFSDPNVYRYTFGSNGFTYDQTCKFLQKNANFASNVGISTLIEKSTNEIVGFAGVLPYDGLGEDDYEIGFVLRQSSWGKGYATEIGLAQCEYTKNVLKKPRVLALASPQNAASIHAINKLGFSYLKDVDNEKGARNLFVLEF